MSRKTAVIGSFSQVKMDDVASFSVDESMGDDITSSVASDVRYERYRERSEDTEKVLAPLDRHRKIMMEHDTERSDLMGH